MKTVIITNGNFFARVILQKLICQKTDQIAGIIIVTGIMGGRSRLASLRRIIQQTGWRHFFYKVQTYLVFMLAEIVFRKRNFFVPQIAQQYGIPIRYTNQVNEAWVKEQINDWKPEILISVSCPQRIPKAVLSLPAKAAINIHSSLLPKYAGISPYIWVLVEGESTTGTTVHIMEEKFDTGPIVVQKELAIPPNISVFTLFYQLAFLGNQALFEAVEILSDSEPQLQVQHLDQRSYFSWPDKDSIRRLYLNGYRLGSFRDFWQAIQDTA